jgi:hypothetical protein
MTMFDDLTKINVPFGLLDRDTQEALKAHGGPLQILNYQGIWGTIPLRRHWQQNYTYRVRPAPPKPREWWINTISHAMIRAEDGLRPAHGAGGWVRVIEKLPE